ETKRCLNAIEAALDWIAGHAHPPVVSSCVTSALKRSGITSGIACSRKNRTYRSSPSCIIVARSMLLQRDFHVEDAALAQSLLVTRQLCSFYKLMHKAD